MFAHWASRDRFFNLSWYSKIFFRNIWNTLYTLFQWDTLNFEYYNLNFRKKKVFFFYPRNLKTKTYAAYRTSGRLHNFYMNSRFKVWVSLHFRRVPFVGSKLYLHVQSFDPQGFRQDYIVPLSDRRQFIIIVKVFNRILWRLFYTVQLKNAFWCFTIYENVFSWLCKWHMSICQIVTVA